MSSSVYRGRLLLCNESRVSSRQEVPLDGSDTIEQTLEAEFAEAQQ